MTCPHCAIEPPDVAYIHPIGEPWREGNVEAGIEYDHGWRLWTCKAIDGEDVFASVPVEHCPKCGRGLEGL